MHPTNHHHQPDNPRNIDSTPSEDTFDAWLDAFVTGRSTPTTEKSASDQSAQDELTGAQSAADQFHGLVAAAKYPVSDATNLSMESIWEDILMSHSTAHVAPHPSLPRARHADSQHGRSPGRLRIINTALSIAAVVALLIAATATAWFNRDHLGFPGNGGDDTPPMHLAALQTGDGQPYQIGLELPDENACTVEPLTVDQVMQRLQANPYTQRQAAAKADRDNADATPVASPVLTEGSQAPIGYTLEQPVYDELAQAQKLWLTCAIYGTPFQRWALESNRMIQAEFQTAYMPAFDLAQIRADLEQLTDGTPIGRFEPISLDGNPTLPMVPTYVEGLNNRQYGDSNATLSIIWVRKDGTILASSGETMDDLKAYMDASGLEQGLPNTWRFLKDPESGVWLLDEFSVSRG